MMVKNPQYGYKGIDRKKEKSEIRLKKIFCIKYNNYVVENEHRNNRPIFTVIFCVCMYLSRHSLIGWLLLMNDMVSMYTSMPMTRSLSSTQFGITLS